MDCREARELLQDDLDGRLAPDGAARLAEHVRCCAACADEKRGLASLRATFRAMPKPSAPTGFRDSVMDALPKGRLLHFPRMLGLLVAVAAVVVVVVTLIPKSSDVAEREVAKASQSAGPPAGAAAPAGGDSWKSLRREGGPSTPAGDEKSNVARDAEGRLADRADTREPSTPPKPAAEFEKKAESVAAPTVRYVVFHDAAAAEAFASQLTAADLDAAKDKSRDAGGGGGAGGAPAGGLAARPATTGAPDPAKADGYSTGTFADDAAAATGRVVARAPMPASLDEAGLVARVRIAGGTLVPAEEAGRVAVLVERFAREAGETDARRKESASEAKAPADAPAPPPALAPPAAPPVVGKSLAPPTSEPAAKRPAPRPSVVIVIVVVGETAKPAGEKR